MFRVAIIEDNPSTFVKVRENIERYYKKDTLKLVNIPCINYLEVFVKNHPQLENEKSLFDSYVQIIENTIADIYIVDWELNFPDLETKNPQDIFSNLPKTFRYRDKYWIFYSGPESNAVLEYLNEFFVSGVNVATPGKSSLIEPPKEKRPNLFNKSIDKAIEFLSSQHEVNWAKNVPYTDWVEIKETFYDLEEADPLEWSFHLSKFVFYKGLVLCMVWDKPNAIILFLHNSQVKVFFCKPDRAKEFTSRLSLGGTRSFFYNQYFFDTNQCLKEEFRNEVNRKAKIIQSEYRIHNKKSKREDKIELIKQITLLKQHGIL